MIEWVWALRLVERLKPKNDFRNSGNGNVQVGCVHGNVTVVHLVVPLAECISCKALHARADEQQ